jgi:SSS family solute:Na+ symporter
MLIASVVVYLLVTIAIGLWARGACTTPRTTSSRGRSLPLYMNTATVFATWFGAETVLSVSAEFAKSGLNGIIADPFGSSFCLVLVALFFARAFYRMDLLTIGDFYRKRYGPTMELATSVVIAISYSAGPRRSSPPSASPSPFLPTARSRCRPASSSARGGARLHASGAACGRWR